MPAFEAFKILAFGIAIFIVISIKNQKQAAQQAKMSTKLVGLDFEVHGKVQGVFFRKYTQKRSRELGLKGWCMNTDQGTVVGRIEGDKQKVEEMKHWLRFIGSPQSAIDKTEFRNEKEISKTSFPDFKIRK